MKAVPATTTLKAAVQSEHIATKKGFLQKLFAVWFDAFVYNQIWEDPRVDLAALNLDGDSRVLTISSGGCNALNYLLAGPQSVTAVDLNRFHIYLLNLKIAAAKYLPSYDDFFAFFGEGKSARSGSQYLQYLAPHLDKDTRDFWGSNTLGGSLLYGERIGFFQNGGLYDHSRNGYFLRFFHAFAHLIGCRPEEVLRAATTEEQEELYEKHVAPFFASWPIRLVGKLPVTMFGLGIPPQQYDELKKDVDKGGTLIDVYRDRTRRLACDFPIRENYFAWQAFARKYDTKDRVALPEYLKEANFATLRAKIDRLSTKIGSATDEIKKNSRGTFNRFVFLDAQDWMNLETVIELWSAIAEKAESGSRIIFRTAGAASPVESDLPSELRAKFDYAESLSKELFEQDRASIYGGFHLYVLNQ